MDISKKFDWQESSFERQLSSLYGHAIRVLTSCRRRESTLKSVGIDLWPAVQLNQIAFLFNSKGAAVAYATWAFVTQEVAERMRVDPEYTLDVSEWNEGDRLWLVDVVAPLGDARNLVSMLRAAYFPTIGDVSGIRRYADGKRRRFIELALRSRVSREDGMHR